MHRSIIDDRSPEARAPKLNIWVDGQGDIYFQIDQSGDRSATVCVCGPGGGSHNEGLAVALKAVLFPGGA